MMWSGTHLISTHYGIDAPTLSSQCMRCRLLSRVGSRAAPRLPAPPRRPARQPRARCRPAPRRPRPSLRAPGAAGAGAHTVGRLVALRGRGRTMRYRHFLGALRINTNGTDSPERRLPARSGTFLVFGRRDGRQSSSSRDALHGVTIIYRRAASARAARQRSACRSRSSSRYGVALSTS